LHWHKGDDLLKDVKEEARGKRHLCKGCCGKEWLAGSLLPGMTSTGTAPASSLKHMSTSLHAQPCLPQLQRQDHQTGIIVCQTDIMIVVVIIIIIIIVIIVLVTVIINITINNIYYYCCY